jgi:hypothetical protein
MPGVRSLLLRTMVARAVFLPVQALGGALSTYLMIRALGSSTYATVGLLIGLQAFCSFLNLGSSAAVGTAAGESRVVGPEGLFLVLVTATRATGIAGAVLLLTSAGIAALGLWPKILGQGEPGLLTSGALTVAAGVFLLQPLSQGAWVLIAAGRTVSATAITSSGAVVSAGLVAVAYAIHAPAIAFVAAILCGQITMAFLASVVASRALHISLLSLGRAVLSVKVRGRSIRSQAAPALVIWVCLPLAYQTDRLLLSHLSTRHELASYNVAALVAAAVSGVITFGSSALWGHFAKERIGGRRPTARSFVRLSVTFGGMGLVVGSALAITLPSISTLLSGGQIQVSLWLALSLGAFVMVQSFHQPSGMLQTDAEGLRFLAIAVVIMTISNIALGVVLTPPLGAVGPVLASLIALTLFLAIPSFLRAITILKPSVDGKPSIPPEQGLSTLTRGADA